MDTLFISLEERHRDNGAICGTAQLTDLIKICLFYVEVVFHLNFIFC